MRIGGRRIRHCQREKEGRGDALEFFGEGCKGVRGRVDVTDPYDMKSGGLACKVWNGLLGPSPLRYFY